MSFILDALKKSESDRQRKNQPDSTFVSSGGGDGPTSRWIWIVGALLMLNIVVLLVVLLKPNGSASSPRVVAQPPPAQQADAATTDDDATFREIVAEARRQQANPDTAEHDTELVVPDRGPAPAQSTVTAPNPQPAPVPADDAADVTAFSDFQTFDQVRAEGTLLPDLRIDIHVYSETPADRFVFVNMTKYKEKATLSEGPQVAEIVPDGVILEYQGTRFLLPRE
jgi:general secretion pathway protein B